MNKEIASMVVDLFQRIDEQVTQFKLDAGIDCPPGCGDCCSSQEVEASVLEMLPIAEVCFDTGSVDLWYEKASLQGSTGTCAFYTPDLLPSGRGHCMIYPWRPLICRLFGYAAVRGKDGGPKLVTCRRLNQLIPEAVQEIRLRVEGGCAVPFFTCAASELAGVDPHLGTSLLPINIALCRAVELVGLARGLESEAAGEPREEKGPSGAPIEPRPPRAA